ncbi:ebhA protein [Bifidobacterium angulatum]|nr:ebhA protein [Bifidobacterium angulatum]
MCGLAAVLIVAVICSWWFLYQSPYNDAVAEYETAVEKVQAKNDNLDAAITDINAVVKGGEKPLDEKTMESAKQAIDTAKKTKHEIGDRPTKISEIRSRTQELSKPLDYQSVTDDLKSRQKELENSILQMKQVTNPNEEFVVTRLKTVPTVTGIKAATEDNDPNGKLHKSGGYTSAVFFCSSNVDQSVLFYDDILENGTDCGGSVEVYETAEAAEKRNDYLGAFDGGILSSGSHTVIGTVVVRTSNELNATKQKTLTDDVISALTQLQ